MIQSNKAMIIRLKQLLNNKLRKKLKKALFFLTDNFHKYFFIFKKYVWPEIIWQFKFTCFIVFIIIIFFFTKRGLTENLTSEYKELFSTLTSAIGTIVAIFFSLILIPLGRIADKFSPKFLKYLRKDPFLIIAFLYSIATLVYSVVFLFKGSSHWIAISEIILFVALVVFLGYLLLHIIWLLDVKNSILFPAHKEIVEKFKKMIPKYKKECDKKFGQTLGKNYKSSYQMSDICYLKVDERATNSIQEELLPIREVVIKSIKDQDLEQAQNSIQTMMSVMVNYLFARKEYYSDDDPLMYFLYTEYKLISQSSNNELKLRLHQFIVECWRLIGMQAAVVEIKKLKRIGGGNLNGLVFHPVQGLKELCLLHFNEMDSYVPGKACSALADIGIQLMNEGYDHQAAIIVEELEKISILAKVGNIDIISGHANQAIMRIYASGVSLRHLGSKDEFNYPYRKINKSIEGILDVSLKNKPGISSNMFLSPFLGTLVDPFRGINLSRISEYGIFSPDLDKFAIEMNLANVEANVKVIGKVLNALALHKEHYVSDQALENLYRILLNLLSYLNGVMAKDHILFYKHTPVIDDELREQCEDVIIDAVSILIWLAKSKADKYLFGNDHLNILFSFYLILLYENKIRSNDKLGELFDKINEIFVTLLSDYKLLVDSSSNDHVYKYYRLLVVLLRENEFIELAEKFDVPKFNYRSGGFAVTHENQFPKTMLQSKWIIKRPGLQVNTYYYNKVEEALKLDSLDFY